MFKNASGSGVFHAHAVLFAIVLFSLAATQPARGQGSETDGGSAAEPARKGVEVLKVTARKQVESLQDVPVTATVLSAQTIERNDLTSLEKIAASTPSLVIGRASNGAGAQLTMRGIGSMPTSIGLEQSVAVVMDGVYYGQGRTINEALFDASQIEVLKGPQSLFFGKNATAGVIAITTADPTDEFEMMARVSFEARSSNLVTEGFISGPLSDKVSARLAVRIGEMFGSYFNNRSFDITNTTFDAATFMLNSHFTPKLDKDLPGTSEQFFRGTVKFEPNDRLTITLKASFMNTVDESNAFNYVPFACPLGVTQFNADIPCKRDFSAYVSYFPDDIAGNILNDRPDGSPFNAYRSYSFTGDIEYELDDFTITSITNYQRNRNNWGCFCQNIPTTIAFIAATEYSTWEAFSNETRLQTSFDGPFNFLVGMFYQDTKRDHDQAANFGGVEDSSQPPELRYLAYDKASVTNGETISAFVQGTLDLFDRLELAAGVRYTHETKKSFLNQPYVNVLLQGLFPQNAPITGDQKFNDWSPEASITYRINDEVTVYTAYKTAYKSGGFSNSALITSLTVTDDILFEPETAEGFEIGLKTVLFDNQLRLNASAYTYKYKNLQVDFFNSITFEFITTNAGGARSKGIEIDLEYVPNGIEGLTLHASLNYNRTRFTNYIAPCYDGQTPADGCTEPFPGFFGQDLSGQPTAIAPEFTASFGFYYETPISNGWFLGLSSDARYSDSYLASSFGAPLSYQPSYVNLDASIRIRSSDDQWEIAVIGKNLTNHFYIGGVQAIPSTGAGTGTPAGLQADQLGLVAQPRTVQFQVTWRY